MPTKASTYKANGFLGYSLENSKWILILYSK
jgi:hypothetical protein